MLHTCIVEIKELHNVLKIGDLRILNQLHQLANIYNHLLNEIFL